MKTKIIFFLFLFTAAAIWCNAQKVDSIYFHLYTDSLKKGTHNYINVDGKLSNGRWLPLTAKEIAFTSSYGTFDGNELILPAVCTEEKVTIKAALKNSQIWKEITIWIKKKPDPDILPTKEEILNRAPSKQTKQKS
jgi:hypothetical protein